MSYDIVIGRSNSDKKKLREKGLVYLGKSYVKMGNYNSLSNLIWLDVAKSHVILIAGKRGSGKSYTLSVLAEEISDLPKEVSQNIAPIIFDTMGIFWTMKYKNEKQAELLQEWKLKPKNLPVKVFVPQGHYQDYKEKQIPVDNAFAIDPSELSSEDWIITFNLSITDPISVLIQNTISKLKKEHKHNLNKYDITQIIEELKHQDSENNKIAMSLFQAAENWGIFALKNQESTKISDIINAGKTTILDLSPYSSIGPFNIRGLVIGILSKKIFEQRMMQRKAEEVLSIEKGPDYLNQQNKKNPLVWLFIDEAHEFLKQKEKTPATDALIQILREGRQPGVSLVLATQQPGVIHRDAMTQSDIVIAHRVTAKPDIEALNSIMQSYLLESIQKSMANLPEDKGSALILDDNSERIYPIKVRPKFTWHGGEAPISVRIEKEF